MNSDDTDAAAAGGRNRKVLTRFAQSWDWDEVQKWQKEGAKTDLKWIDNTLCLVLERQRPNPEYRDLLGEAKEKYNKTKKNAKKEICEHCGAKDGENGCNIMVCSRCFVGAWCSKECQKADWKKHKLVCKELKMMRDEEQCKESYSSKDYIIPRMFYVIPPEITGYDKPVRIGVCIWEYE